MKIYVPIGYADFEHIEVACMDRYEVEVVTHDGALRGLAIATDANDTGEYLIIQLDNNRRESVRVDYIKRIIVLSDDRRFDERTFERLADAC